MFALAGTQPQILQVVIPNIGSYELWRNNENCLFIAVFKRTGGDVISHWLEMQIYETLIAYSENFYVNFGLKQTVFQN